MRKSRRVVSTVCVGLLVMGVAAPLVGQSTGAAQPDSAMDPALTGHVHSGEMGAMSLILEQNLRCNCSCGLDTHSCQFQMQCGTSPVWAERIRRSLAAGDSPEVIEASFVADFGATVLMAPPAEGFNLVGYFLPSVAIIAAGVLIGLLVRTGATRGEPMRVLEIGDADAARLRNALQELDEAEGPDW